MLPGCRRCRCSSAVVRHGPTIFSSAAATRARSPVNSTLTPFGNDITPTWSPGLSSERIRRRPSRHRARPPWRCLRDRRRAGPDARRRPSRSSCTRRRWSVSGCVVPRPPRLCETNSADSTRRGAPSIVSVKSFAVSPETGPRPCRPRRHRSRFARYRSETPASGRRLWLVRSGVSGLAPVRARSAPVPRHGAGTRRRRRNQQRSLGHGCRRFPPDAR